MINENLSLSHTFIRTFDIDLHIKTIDKERNKLVYFKVISSGHTHTHVSWSPDCVVTLKTTDFSQVATQEKFYRHFI
jgi:hypothetical protein